MLTWSSGRSLAGRFGIIWVWIHSSEIEPHRALVWVEKRTSLILGPGLRRKSREAVRGESGFLAGSALGRQVINCSSAAGRWSQQRAGKRPLGSIPDKISWLNGRDMPKCILGGSLIVDVLIGYSVPPALRISFPNLRQRKSQPSFQAQCNNHSLQEASSPILSLVLSLPNWMGSLAPFHTR